MSVCVCVCVADEHDHRLIKTRGIQTVSLFRLTALGTEVPLSSDQEGESRYSAESV